MTQARKIGQVLIDLKVLTPAEVDRVLTAMRRRGDDARFGQVAKEMNLLRDEEILAALAVQMELVPRSSQLSLRRVLRDLMDPKPATLAPPTVKPRKA